MLVSNNYVYGSPVTAAGKHSMVVDNIYWEPREASGQVIKNALIKEYELKVEAVDLKAVGREVAAAQLQQYGLYGLTNEQLDGFAVRCV